MSLDLNHAIIDRIMAALEMERPPLGSRRGDQWLDLADEIAELVWRKSQWYKGCLTDSCAYWDELPAGQGYGCIPALIYEVTGRYPCANWDCPCFEPTTGMKGKHPDGLPDPF